MKDQKAQLWIISLLLACSCVTSARARHGPESAEPGVAAQCSSRDQCAVGLNSLDVRCIHGSCRAVCNSGFKAFGTICVSDNIMCGKGQQPHANGARCVVCPKNTYKSAAGNMPCRACPNEPFTAGTEPDSYSSAAKCLSGGLVSRDKVEPPRLQQFRQQLEAAQQFMSSPSRSSSRNRQISASSKPSAQWHTTEGRWQHRGNSSSHAAQHNLAVLSIAGSPQTVTPYQTLLGMPSKKPRVQDQALCATCVNAAFVSAAEAAVAAAAGISTQFIEFSPVYAYFCDPPLVRSCSSGWTFQDALRRLSATAETFFPAASCTQGFDFGAIQGSSPSQLAAACDDVFNTCPASDVLLDCSYQSLTDFWEMQRAIRVHGAVVTRITMHAALVNFFKESPRSVYNETSTNLNTSGGIPHAVVLVGYNNTGQFWWAQNSFGTAFADQGVFKVAYGAGMAANPNETFALQCRLAPTYPINPAKKWPLQVAPRPPTSKLFAATCFWYTARGGDYMAGIAEHFGINLVRLVKDNMQALTITIAGKPDLTTPLAGKRLTMCGVFEDLQDTASLECGAGEYQGSSGDCQVCPHDTYNESPGPGPCKACPPDTMTTGCKTSDHDSASDCTPVATQLLCEQFIGRYDRSGPYTVTIRCNRYQVYCDMDTDGGGWTLILSYNVGAYSNAKDVLPRDLNDGFPILSNNSLGTDESDSVGRGGSWGHVSPQVLSLVPNAVEMLGLFEMPHPSSDIDVMRAHYKCADEESLAYILNGAGSININTLRHSHSPMPDQNEFIPLDGLGSFVATDLWPLAHVGVPVRHAVYIRGQNVQPIVCEPGWYQVGWSCHICPDHTYKDSYGPGPCAPCPSNKVATAGILGRRMATNHDDANDCKPAIPDTQWTVQRGDGSEWAWSFFWNTRADAVRAEAICRLQGGHLVTVGSDETSQLLNDKVTGDGTGRPPFPLVHALTIMWIGLYSNTSTSSRSGPWGWYSGATYPGNYTPWGNFQPDNYLSHQGLNVAFLLDNNRMWDDYYHTMYQEFVCERKTFD